jgi:hypothetical protein
VERLLSFAALCDLALQGLVGSGQGARGPKQLHENAHLRFQDERVERFGQIIHRARAITFQDIFIFLEIGGQKQNRM